MTPPPRFTSSPTPSTCPATRCPPSESPMRRDRSRLTGPGSSSPVVTRRVSADTSARKPRGVSVVTVRHTPWTAIESPTATPDMDSDPQSTSKGSTLAMRPTAWTMPVNIGRRGYRKRKGTYWPGARLCHHLPNSFSADRADAASTITIAPTATAFAAASGTESKPSTKGARTSHAPAKALTHSTETQSKLSSKCEPSASSRPTHAALAVAASLCAYPSSQGDTASQRPSVKLPQSCHFADAAIADSLTRVRCALQHWTAFS